MPLSNLPRKSRERLQYAEGGSDYSYAVPITYTARAERPAELSAWRRFGLLGTTSLLIVIAGITPILGWYAFKWWFR